MVVVLCYYLVDLFGCVGLDGDVGYWLVFGNGVDIVGGGFVDWVLFGLEIE